MINMFTITSGEFFVYRLFEVANEVDLGRLRLQTESLGFSHRLSTIALFAKRPYLSFGVELGHRDLHIDELEALLGAKEL